MSKTENNKLIADFMEMKYAEKRSFKDGKWTHIISSLKRFESDWNWLMPVVGKIGSIMSEFPYDSDEHEKFYEIFGECENWFLHEDKATVYRAVVEFIEWYNQNQKP